MSEKKSTLSHRWHQEVWNKGREDAIDEMMHENVITHGLDDLKGNGMAAFKEFYRSFREQFPSIQIEVQDVITEGDLQNCRCLVSVTNDRGEKVQFTGMTIVRIKDGKIIEGWNNFDFLSMYQQLGYKMVPAEV